MGSGASKSLPLLLAQGESMIKHLKPPEVDVNTWVVCYAIISGGYKIRQIEQIDTNRPVNIQPGFYATYDEGPVQEILLGSTKAFYSRSKLDEDLKQTDQKTFNDEVEKLVVDAVGHISLRESDQYESFDKWWLSNKHLVRLDNGSRLTRFINLKMRPLYEQPVGEISAIGEYTPGFPSACALEIILIKHLIGCHLSKTQNTFIHLKRNEMNDLQYKHFNHLFCGTNKINSNVPVLAGEFGSLTHQLSGAESNTFLQHLTKLIVEMTAMDNDTFLNQVVKTNDLLWNSVVDQVWSLNNTLIDEIWVKHPKRNDIALCNFLATFFHEVVGDKQLRSTFDGVLPFRVRIGGERDTTKTFAWLSAAAVVGVSTRSIKLGAVEEVDLKDRYLRYLNGIKQIKNINKYVNPDNLEISVGY